MIRCHLLLSLLFAAALPAQNALYLDLSGEWRQSADDRPEYAQPGFDDSGWTTVRLPWTARQDGNTRWLRREVQLPAGTDLGRLALTLGALSEAYEFYIDGQLAGKAAGFSRAEAQIARPRTFNLPRVNGHRFTVAVRVWRAYLRGTNTWRLYREGPYALHYAGQFPADYGELTIRKKQWSLAPDLVVAGIELLLALIIFAFWISERQQRYLLWLALYITADAILLSATILLLSPDAHPWLHDWRNVPLPNLRTTLLATLVIAIYKLEHWWLTALVWLLCLANITLRSFDLRDAYRLGTNLSYLIILAIIAYGWRRQEVFPTRWMHHAVAALLVILSFTLANRLGNQFGTGTSVRIGESMLTIAMSPAVSVLCTLLLFALVLWQHFMHRQRLASEMEAARAVQQLLIPAAGDRAEGIEIDAVYEPAQEVGGDFHWRRINPDGSLTLVAGDVSGKGLKAAMLVSVIVGLLRAAKSSSPAQLLATLNDGLTEEPATGFVTCCCLRVHGDQFTIASAGHPAPYADGRELPLEENLPLGVVRGITWSETTITASRLTLVSDGVPEAATAKGELFGFERTCALSTQSAREIAEAAKQWGQNDDITVVTIGRNANP